MMAEDIQNILGRLSVSSAVREWFSDWGGKLTIFYALLVAFHLLLVTFHFGGEDLVAPLSNVIAVVIYSGPCILAWRASRNPLLPRRRRHAWLFISLADLSFLLGEATWLYLENFLGIQPFPSWADAGYLLFYPLMMAGLLSLVDRFKSGEEQLNFWLDAGVILIAGGAVLWYFLLGPIADASDGSSLKTALSLAYPIGDLVLLLGIASLLLRRSAVGSRGPIKILLAGVVINFLADFIFGYQNLAGTYVTGNVVDALFTLACFPVMMGAHLQHLITKRQTTATNTEMASVARSFLLPYAAIGVVYFVLLRVAFEHPASILDYVVLIAGAVTAIVTFRQFMFVRENTKANRALTELEDRIQGIYSASTDAIGLATFEGTLTEVNDSFVRLTGYSREHIVGAMRYQDFVPDDYLDRTVTPEMAIEGGKSLEYERDLLRPDGTLRRVTTTLYAVDDANGNPAAMAIVIRDITELEAAHARLSHVFAHSPGVIYRHLVNGYQIIPLTASPNIERLLGFKVDETLSMDWWLEHLHPDDSDRAVISIGETFENGSNRSEYRVRHKDGSYRWIDDSRSLVLNAEGEPVEMIGVWLDITEKKAAEASVAESRELYDDLFENATDLIQAVRPDGSFSYVNRAWRETLGYSEDEIEKVSMFDIIDKDHQEHCREEMRKAMSGQAVNGIETVFLSKDGRQLSVEGNITCRFVDGLPVHARGIFRDITDRKAAENRLRAINEGMRLQTAALESTANGVAITDTKGIIEWINPAFTQLTGYSAEDVIGKSASVLKSGKNPEGLYEDLWGTILKGDVWHGDLINRRKDGTFYNEEMTITPVRHDDGKIGHFVAIKQDVTASRIAEETLRASQAKLARAQEIARMGYWEWNMVTGEIFWSDEAFRVLGLEPTAERVTHETFMERVHPDDREMLNANADRALKTKHWESVEYRIVRPDGTHGIILSEGVLSEDTGAESYKITGIMLDITARRESEGRFRSIVESANDGIILMENNGQIVSWNEAAQAIFGYERDEVLGNRLPMLFPDTYTDEVLAKGDCTAVDVGGLVLPGCRGTALTGKKKNGEEFPLEITVSSWEGESGDFYSAIVRDITQRKTLEDKLTYQTLHDPLTDLANRVLFKDRVTHALKRIKRTKATVGVLFIDLDNFKNVNDTLGHAAGDELLIGVAERIKSCLRDGDTAARFGGDEFAVLIEDSMGIEGAALVAQRIHDSVLAPFFLGGNEAHVDTSIGIAITTRGKETPDQLLQNADVAMYIAKTGGKGRYVVFESHMQEAIVKRVKLESDMRTALKKRQFEVYYQPIVNLESEAIEGMEALVRWNHPTFGLIPPSEFIKVAEETHLILPLGRWVLETACIQAKKWHDSVEGSDSATLTVNIATQQFQDDGLLSAVKKALSVSGLPARSLVLEITETTMLLNTDKTLKTIEKLKALGVRLAIDDFGTGYSSLSYLQKFEIDVLKIDKSFVDNIARGDDNSAVARAIIAMGQSLRMKTIAEGIESEAQQIELQSLGCQYGQGYHFAKPLSTRDMEEYLLDHEHANRPLVPGLVSNEGTIDVGSIN